MDLNEEKLQKQDCYCVHLPEEIINKILTTLTDLSDLFRCRAVSLAWHYIATQIITSLPNPLLHRIASQIHQHLSRSSTDLKQYSVNSHRGWFLVCQNKNKNIVLYNPLSRQNIKLPQLPKEDPNLRLRFVTSSLPTEGNCIVLVCYSEKNWLGSVFCSPGDEKWTFVHHSDRNNYYDIHDMIHYKGIFYAVGISEFERFDLNSRYPYVNGVYGFTRNYSARYLVESPSQDLLLVESGLFTKETRGIRFSKMTSGGRVCEWEEMKNHKFGYSVSLFLAPCDSVFMPTIKDADYRRNCVYYLYDESRENRKSDYTDTGSDNTENCKNELFSSKRKIEIDIPLRRWWFKG